MRSLLLLTALLLLCAGCGKKGPLYLPDQNPKPTPANYR